MVIQQGEVRVEMIDGLPVNMADLVPVTVGPKGYVVAHSERGHHHIISGGTVLERVKDVPAGMRIFYAILDDPQALIQDAPHAHEQHALSPGVYEVRISREFRSMLGQARQVQD